MWPGYEAKLQLTRLLVLWQLKKCRTACIPRFYSHTFVTDTNVQVEEVDKDKLIVSVCGLEAGMENMNYLWGYNCN